MNFDFLNKTTLQSVEKTENKKSGKVAMELNPTNGADFRLFKSGAIYPSLNLVMDYSLEYNTEGTGNGFDVFSSKDWNMYPKEAQHVVFINTVEKKEAKVSLFGSAREVEGTLTSVMEQGSKTFGEQLINMLEDVYGVKLFESSKYVDLKIVEDVTIPSLDGIYFIPKLVNKGENKGQMSTVRRENINIHPLAIYNMEDIKITANQEEPIITGNSEESHTDIEVG